MDPLCFLSLLISQPLTQLLWTEQSQGSFISSALHPFTDCSLYHTFRCSVPCLSIFHYIFMLSASLDSLTAWLHFLCFSAHDFLLKLVLVLSKTRMQEFTFIFTLSFLSLVSSGTVSFCLEFLVPMAWMLFKRIKNFPTESNSLLNCLRYDFVGSYKSILKLFPLLLQKLSLT